MRLLRLSLLVSVSVLAALAQRPAQACGPFPPRARFWHDRMPGPSLDAFLAGELGILSPRFRGAYSFVAYRYLSGLGLDEAGRALVRTYWESPSAGMATRIDLPEEILRAVDSYKAIQIVEQGYVYSSYFQNCLPDSFTTAEATYRDRAQKLGEDEMRGWVEAQAQVFALCGGESVIPRPLPARASPLARADRDYQIASAHFYAGNFDEAHRRFAAIGEDRSSPWRNLARYLVARALIRDWNLGSGGLASANEAEATLRGILADDDMRELHQAAEGLLGFVSARLHPEERRSELAARLSRERLAGNVRQDLIDYLLLLGPDPSSRVDDMTDWLGALELERKDAARIALERWRESRSLPWLVLALVEAQAREVADALLAAASRIERSSPGYWTVTYHRARLLAELGREGEARALVDGALEDGGLSLSDRNRFLSLRVTWARDLEEFLRFSQMVPVEVGYDDGGPGSLYLDERLRHYGDGRALFDGRAAIVFNRFLTPSLLRRAIGSVRLAPHLARPIAIATWTRAVLLGEENAALELAPVLGKLEPALASDLEAYAAAAPGEERVFSAALVMLRFPGLSPFVEPELGRVEPVHRIDDYRHNWWCGLPSYEGPEAGRDSEPGFLSAEEREAARGMRAKMEALEPGPIELGRRVLSRVRSRPDDARAPESLHLVVRSTRYGCRDTKEGVTDFGDVSKEAFQTLHRRYPRTPWAERTKYWFR